MNQEWIDAIEHWVNEARGGDPNCDDEPNNLWALPSPPKEAKPNGRYLSSLVIARAPQSLVDSRNREVDYTVCLPYYVAVDDRQYRVRAGAQTNFASVPRYLRGLVGRVGRWTEASVVHDAAYRGDLETCVHGAWVKWEDERKEADRIFRELMDAAKVGWRRYPIYWAVRLFGRSAFSPKH